MTYLYVELAQRGVLAPFKVYLDENSKSLLIIISKSRHWATYLCCNRINKTSFHLQFKDKHIVKRKYMEMADIIEEILNEELIKKQQYHEQIQKILNKFKEKE